MWLKDILKIIWYNIGQIIVVTIFAGILTSVVAVIIRFVQHWWRWL